MKAKTTKRELWTVYNPASLAATHKYIRGIAYWVGRFIIQFNELENFISFLIAYRTDFDYPDYAHVFLSGMPFSQKVDILERHFKFYICSMFQDSDERGERDKHLRTVKKLIDELRNVGFIRNIIAHADYSLLETDGQIRSKIRVFEDLIEEHRVCITKDFILDAMDDTIQAEHELSELDVALFGQN